MKAPKRIKARPVRRLNAKDLLLGLRQKTFAFRSELHQPQPVAGKGNAKTEGGGKKDQGGGIKGNTHICTLSFANFLWGEKVEEMWSPRHSMLHPSSPTITSFGRLTPDGRLLMPAGIMHLSESIYSPGEKLS